jgi:hypothetical protein
LLTPSTLGSITQPLVTCSGALTSFNVTGLLPNSTSTLSYTVNGGATQTVTGVVADASGNATFTRSFSGSNNGQVFAITAIQRTDITPNCTTAITANNTVTITVQPLVTYYADADGDGFGNIAVLEVTCQGQPSGYVTNNTDCDDTDPTKNATFTFYADGDADGFGAGLAVTLCAVNATTPPAGYSVNNTDCNDADATVNATFTFYADNDADGFGAGSAVTLCAVNATTPPAGYSVNNTDCDDTSSAINAIVTTTTTETVCDTYTWSVNGSTYTSSTTQTVIVNSCDTRVLNLTVNSSSSGTTTITACDTYTWDAPLGNGTTYTSSQTGITNVSTNAAGCPNTQTLNLTINNSTSSSDSQTACDSYTWTAGTGTTYTESGIYTSTGLNAAGCTDTKTIVLTINNSTTSSETQSACGSYFWSESLETYSTSGTYTSTSTNAAGCPDTKVLILTIIPVVTNTTTVTGCDSYTWPVNNETYTESGSFSVTTGCNTEFLELTINTSSVYYADTDGDGYGNASSSTNACSQPTGYVTDNTDCDDTRATVYPGATEVANGIDDDCDGSIDEGIAPPAPGVTNSTVCVGSPSVTLTATALSGYTLRWYSAATGGTALTAAPVVVTTAATVKSFWVSQRLGTGPESARAQITVTVVALPATPGTITGTAAICVSVGTTNELTYSVAAVTGASSYQWTVPTGATIVSGQGTNTVSVNFENVSAGVTPALTIGVQSVNSTGCLSLAKTLALTRVLPTAPAALVMTNPASATPTTAIVAVGPFIGTTTELTLTATASATATSYTWTLPTGVNQLSGGNSNVITVNFAGVGTGTTTLPISVQSTNGCGNSTLKTLSLTRALPAKPLAITASVSSICPLVGTSTVITYTIASVSGAFADGYAWTVPTGGTIVSGQGSTQIGVTYDSSFVAGNVSVTASNGVGTSAATTLAVAKVLPTAPAALVMTNPASATPTTAIVAVGPFIGTTTELTLTATASATATSYTWTLPTGVNQLSGGNSNVITVNFAGVGTGTTALPISVQSTNGCGSSALKTLSLTRALPATPGKITTTQANVCLIAGSAESTVTYTVVPVVGAFANGYTWTVPTGASIVGSATGNSIVVSYSSNFNAAGSVTVTSSNGVGTSLTAATLAVAATAPAVPATLVMTNPASATPTTAVVAAGPFMGTSTELTLTAAPVAGAVSYAWTLPAGVNQV